MIVFIDDILSGNIEELLGEELYAQVIAHIVVWWSVLPMAGIIFAFSILLVSLFRPRTRG